MKFLAASMLCFGLLMGGCSSYVAAPEKESAKLGTWQRFFVKSNFDDNHGMDARIAQALQDHGLTAGKGPLTMMPPTTQALVIFEEHWTWDFKTHLTGLRIQVSDAKNDRLAATAIFTGPTALATSPDDVVDRLVTKLLKLSKPAKK